jgi:hypothetical protein
MPIRLIAEAVHRCLAPDARQLPQFIIPGAMKAGTTSLFEHLRGHPQLRASRDKEVHYFDMKYDRGARWYASQFPRWARVKGVPSLGFEASPYYLFDPRVPRRVRELLPRVKIVVVLRDPVDRAFSHYQNNRRLGREPLSFEEAIEAEPSRLAGEEQRLIDDPLATSWPHKWYSYLSRGLYRDQLLRWRAHFPTGQIHVIDAGRLFQCPGAVLAEVLEFLGVDPWEPSSLAPFNEGGYRETMRADTRRRLAQFFEPHERALADLIGWCPSARRAQRI